MNSNERIFRDARTRVMFLLSQGLRARVEEEITLALRANGVNRVRVAILAGKPGRLEIVAPGQERLLAMWFGRGPISVAATPENLVEFLARARGWSPYQLR
jgi:hypothetical protein